MVTVGVGINTRLVSVAVLTKGRLAAYWTHLYKSSWSPEKRAMIIAGFEPCVRQYCINRVVLSIPSASHQTTALWQLVEAIESFFNPHNIIVTTITPEAFGAVCPVHHRGYKKALMQVMVQRFPELTRFYHKELRNNHKYYFKLFEAVASAVLAAEGDM